MPELRKDPVTSTWVIFSAERSKRPSDFPHAEPDTLPEHDDACPFCYGNETKTPPEVEAIRKNDSKPDTPGWYVRVVPNKFPALSLNEQADTTRIAGNTLYQTLPGYGAHEVIVESPKHNASLSSHPLEQLEMIWRIIRSRYSEHEGNGRLRYVQAFKNHGSTAGASLKHSHFQIIATPTIPSTVVLELGRSLQYYIDTARCIYCDIIHQEMADQARVIEDTEHFLATCPFASRFPFEICILPKRHDSDFADITDTEVRDLSALTKKVFGKMDKALSDPPFNLVIHSAPIGLAAKEHYHWHIEIIPRLTKLAGFEFGTGYYINPTVPEQASRFLNEKEE